ncbi:hypothetical protein [Bauldia sp.]|uniref:pyroglutamyl-peptidase I family protein n=1 Tax=Bauldia sp. TaxID=2575872 RepID=UPI003BAA9182
MSVGLLTGSEPFAGLPDNPASALLSHFENRIYAGIRVLPRMTPANLSTGLDLLKELIAEHRPDFVISLGLALGEPVLRVETIGINTLDFAIPDNEGIRPLHGGPIDETGPAARKATWEHRTIVDALLAADLPARASHSAGTHMCNATLYTSVGAMEAAGLSGPCGFLHLPYLPEQVARFMRSAPPEGDRAPRTERSLASMSLENQLRGLGIVLEKVAARANGSKG